MILSYVILAYVMLRHPSLWYIMLCYVILHQIIILYFIALARLILYSLKYFIFSVTGSIRNGCDGRAPFQRHNEQNLASRLLHGCGAAKNIQNHNIYRVHGDVTAWQPVGCGCSLQEQVPEDPSALSRS